MTGSDGVVPSRAAAGAIVVPAVTGVLAALALLALGQAPVICNGVQVCAEPASRFDVAIWWTAIVLVLAAAATVTGARATTSRRVLLARVLFGLQVAATLVGAIVTLAVGGFTIPLFYL
ncbi:hypothetical protein FLP10_04525 [Agromyces intestinalis]|uniref:Uncharacterized protein n=1 Tax=Agromyces intestinalis TaxID=2592652 RepID=A0A5C1YFJ4_9MICO|nr:hypothetical protein [Agromyces intestinalis]QEO13767.1 hypothetical protein FLP10_04525 [Agromyces intestinalis]